MKSSSQIYNVIGYSYRNLEISSSLRDKLSYIKKFKDGWDFGEGKEISKDVLELVRNICVKFDKLLNVDLHPLTEGGVKIVLNDKSDDFVDINVNHDLSLYYIIESGKGFSFTTIDENYVEKIEELDEIIKKQFNLSTSLQDENLFNENNHVKALVCLTFAPYTFQSITPIKEDLIRIPLSHTETGGYPFFAKIAQTRNQKYFVST